MKFIRLDILDPHDGCLVSWHQFPISVSDAIARYADEHDMPPKDVNQIVTEHNVANNTAALVHWLNVHFKTDNG